MAGSNVLTYSKVVLHSFSDATGDGVTPTGLIEDQNGNLFGTTQQGGTNGYGAVFEIAKDAGSPTGYAATDTVLTSFTGTNGDGEYPEVDLVEDQNGNLLGTTESGGVNGHGTVFEIAKDARSPTGYAATDTVLASFTGANGDGEIPVAGLIEDQNGNLFGTTIAGGANNDGTVFEIAKDAGSPTGYAGTDTVLASTSGDVGDVGLLVDQNGDLFGTSFAGGADNFGSVFEIAKEAGSPTGYAATETVLASFTGAHGDGQNPSDGLIEDQNGNLFGTTSSGGANDDGTVFEIARDAGSPTGYAATDTVLASFTGTNGDGAAPDTGLVADQNGDLFGTTSDGGLDHGGTVFELAKDAGSPTGYAAREIVIATFTGANGDGLTPNAGLIEDQYGDLFGTTQNGGTGGSGTAFELVPRIAPTIDQTAEGTSQTPTISGTGEAGAAITLTLDGTTITDAATVQADDTWSYSPTAPLPVGQNTAIATETIDGMISAASNTDTFDIDPAPATYNLSNGERIDLSGKISSASTVNFLDSDNDVLQIDADQNNIIHFEAQINGFQSGNSIILTNINSAHFAYDQTSNMLDFFGLDNQIIAALHIEGNYKLSDFNLQFNSTPNSLETVHISTNTLPPTVAVSSDETSVNASSPPATITFGFSEPVTGFDAGDVTRTGGTLGPLTQNPNDPTQYSATFTPTAGFVGAGSVTVAAGSYTGVADGPLGSAGGTTIAEDLVPPSVGVSSDEMSLNASSPPATITFGFSEAVSGFDAGDVTTTGGTLGAITQSQTNPDDYSATFTPTAGFVGTGSVTVAAGSYTDLAGNPGSAGGTTIAEDLLVPSMPVPTAIPPATIGTHNTTDVSEASVRPFSGVTVVDGNAGATDALTIALTGGGGMLSGAGLIANADGSYALAATDPATLSSELDALNFTPTNGVPGATVSTTFTLTDTSSAGSMTSDSGTTVTDTGAPTPLPAPSPTPPSPPQPAPVDRITVDQTDAYHDGVFTITGTVSSTVGVEGVEFTALIGGQPDRPVDLGAATVNANGTFTFEDKVDRRLQGFVTATETDDAGLETAAAFHPALQGGSHPHMDRYRITPTRVIYSGTTFYRPDGSDRVTVTAPNETLEAKYSDTFENDGRPHTTFVFGQYYGSDTLNLFRVDGVGHDILALPSSDFTSIADVLRNTQNVSGGSAVITDPTTGDSIKLTGVTKAQLVHHQADIVFHP